MKVNKLLTGIFVGAAIVATVLDLKNKGLGYKMLPDAIQQVADSVFEK